MKRPTKDFWKQIALLDQNLDNVTYYQVLGLESGAESEAIRNSFERQVRVVHPDRHAREEDEERKQQLTRVYARIGEAFRVLSHPQRRIEYDSGLNTGKLRHRKSRADTHRGAIADPHHPQAKSLFEQAQAFIARDERRAARSKLALALQYEPGSQAIAEAIISCGGQPATTSDSLAARAEARKAEARKAEAQKAEARKAEAQKIETQKIETQKIETQKIETQKIETQKIEAQAQAELQRAHKRVPLGESIEVTCEAWEHMTKLYMQNISRGGMLMRCDEVLKLGTILELALKAPDGERIELPAEVVRHIAPETEGQRPAMGVRFLIIPEATRHSFELLLRAAGIRAEAVEEPFQGPLSPDQGPEEEEIALTIKSAQELIDGGSARDAIPMLQIAIHLHPDNDALRATFHLAAGLTARSMGLHVPAHRHFERALRYDADSTLILRHLRDDTE